MSIKKNQNTHMSYLGLNFLFVLVLIVGISGCSKSSKKNCTGTLKHQEKTYVGKADNGANAGRFACNKYCLEADPQVETRYAIWVNSPKGKAAGSPAKQKAIYEDKELLDFVTINCAKRCLTDATAGKHRLKVECQ